MKADADAVSWSAWKEREVLIFMEKQMYICPKCGNTHYEKDQFQATGGNFAKIETLAEFSLSRKRTDTFYSIP